MTSRQLRIAGVLGAVLFPTFALAGPLDPPGGPVAPTMKTLQEIEPRQSIDFTNTPGDGTSLFKIASAGSYYLTGSYSVSSGRNFLQITASNVTVDLNGFRIAGQAGSLDGIDVMSGVTNVRIYNGTFANLGEHAIDEYSASAVSIENVGVNGGGSDAIQVGTSSLVKG
jgi:hypothetical protein